MAHKNYHEIKAKNNFELGLILGEKFKSISRRLIDEKASEKTWGAKADKAKKYIEITKKYFPQYVEELEGYAAGMEADFMELWTRSLEDEFDEEPGMEKCTTFITNGGKTIAHNEDWEPDSGDNLCLLKKTVGGKTIFEIYYFCTLGGNALSINSSGHALVVNTLHHKDKGIGVPRNVIARALSETNNPNKDFERFFSLPRSSGLNYVLVNTAGAVWDIESTAQKHIMIKPPLPFIHTNHYLTELKDLEAAGEFKGSRERFNAAQARVKEKMSAAEILDVMNDASNGPVNGIDNERTVAKAMIDFDNLSTKVWLARESETGWVGYELDFLGI